MPVFTAGGADEGSSSAGTVVTEDEGIRRGTTAEKLAGLKPAFTEDGVIHAGNSSQISDGAAALMVMTADNAVRLGLTRLVRYRAGAVTGADPVLMLTGPIPATEKVLHKAGVRLDEIGVFEVNGRSRRCRWRGWRIRVPTRRSSTRSAAPSRLATHSAPRVRY